MNKVICLFLTTLFCIALNVTLSAQDSTKSNSESIPFIRFQYSYLFPSEDFEDRYGQTSSVGGALGYKLQSNWQIEIEGSYYFTRNINTQGLLDNIINEAGDVTDADGELVKVIYELRGLSFFISGGKVIPLNQKNSNSGLLIKGGIGYMQHRIKVDFRDGQVFQFSDEMLKGFDRLHTGFASRQFIGYQHFGKRNLVNFYIGLEVEQGYTLNRRKYNYDTRSFDTERKFDLLYGLRFGWAIPFRSRESEEFYYY